MTTLEELEGKEIRINGELFTVKASFTNLRAQEETLVLTKPIKEMIPEEPKTIQDLGYVSANDVHFPTDELDIALDFIDQSQGQTVELAMVDPSGLISLHEVRLVGLSLKDPELYRVVIDGDEKRMKIDFMLKAFLLAKKFKFTLLGHKAAKADMGFSDEDTPELDAKEIYDDLFEEALKYQRSPNGDPRSMNTDIPDIDKIIKDILKNAKSSGELDQKDFTNFDGFDEAMDSIFKGVFSGRKFQ